MSELGSYRYHMICAISRGVFVNLGWLFAGSFFISQYGGTLYAPIYMSASIISLLCYFLFIYLSIRSSQLTYLGTFVGVTGLTLGQWFLGNSLWLGFSFCAGVLFVDLVGATIGGNLLQDTVNPSVFKRIYQRTVSGELVTRLACTALFFILAKYDSLDACYSLMMAAAALHIFGMLKVRQSLSKPKENSTTRRQEMLGDALSFVRSNPLVKLALVVTVWTYAIKFLGENLYFLAVESRFDSQVAVGEFMSQVSFGLIIFCLAFKRFVGDRLVERGTPSQLLMILPVGLIAFLGGALVLPIFWPIIAMYIFFMTTNRSIQLPVSRQCLVPVPDTKKHAIVTLIFLISGGFSILLSGLLTVAKPYLVSDHYIYLMIALTLPIFVLLLNIDTFYLRNLWSMYVERVQGVWVDNLWSTSSLALRSHFKSDYQIFDHFDQKSDEGKGQVVAQSCADALLAGYKSDCRDTLEVTVSRHRTLFQSDQVADLRIAMEVGSKIGLSHKMRSDLLRLSEHSDKQVQDLAARELRVIEFMNSLNLWGLRAHTKRKLKVIVYSLIDQVGSKNLLRKVRILTRLGDRRLIAKFVDILNYYQGKGDASAHVWLLIQDHGLTIMPLVEAMMVKSYNQAESIREILQLTALRDEVEDELVATVATILTDLTSKYFSIWTRKADEVHWQSRFQHVLFLEEYRLQRSRTSSAVIDAIDGLFEFGYEDKLIAANMHLEALKHSQFYLAWSTMLDPQFYSDRAQFKDRSLRAFKLVESVTGNIASKKS